MSSNSIPDTGKIESEAAPAAEPSAPVVVHTSIDVRSVSLAVLAVLAVIFVLQWGRDVFIPLMLGLVISYALSPMVNRMQAWRIPRAIGAAIMMIAIVGGAGYAVYTLSDEATRMIEALPDAAKKLRQTMRKDRTAPEGAVDKVQRAAEKLQNVANETTAPAPKTQAGVVRVQVEKPMIDAQSYLWSGTLGAVGFLGQTAIVLSLAYFLLVSGDSFRRKLVRITGPTLSKKKITLHVLDDITGQIQRYLMVQVFTSFLVGVATWLVLAMAGLENAAIWGIAAGLFNSIPYLGPVVVTGATALIAFMQFGTINMALLVGGATLVITSLEGFLLTPWLIGRASRMSAVVVFVGVLFWGWLWGVWGLLLGMPILMMIKAVCDRVEDLKPFGELLGE